MNVGGICGSIGLFLWLLVALRLLYLGLKPPQKRKRKQKPRRAYTQYTTEDRIADLEDEVESTRNTMYWMMLDDMSDDR